MIVGIEVMTEKKYWICREEIARKHLEKCDWIVDSAVDDYYRKQKKNAKKEEPKEPQKPVKGVKKNEVSEIPSRKVQVLAVGK
jgi:hypothetical protein